MAPRISTRYLSVLSDSFGELRCLYPRGTTKMGAVFFPNLWLLHGVITGSTLGD